MTKTPCARRIAIACLALSLSACGSSVVPNGDAASADDGAVLADAATHDASAIIDAGVDAARDASRPDASRPDASSPDAALPPDAGTEEPEPPTVRFVAMGDGGEGNDAQYLVGHAVAQICAADGCDFVLYLGDNFYDTGVSGVDDPQWETKFEMPYAELTDLGVPFYVVLGNHDYGGDGAGIEAWKGAHQVDYSARSATWTMPDEYYSFVHAHVTFVGLDTNAIFWGVGLGTQQTWAEDTLRAAATPWRIVFGHHPYISNGKHGNAGNYEGLPSWVPIASGVNVRRFFDESLCDGPVDVYISGHDHNRQWLPERCGIQHFVSGAAAKTTDLEGRGNLTSFEDDSEPGFLYVEISGDTLRGRFHGEDGSVQFEQTMTRPSIGTR